MTLNINGSIRHLTVTLMVDQARSVVLKLSAWQLVCLMVRREGITMNTPDDWQPR